MVLFYVPYLVDPDWEEQHNYILNKLNKYKGRLFSGCSRMLCFGVILKKSNVQVFLQVQDQSAIHLLTLFQMFCIICNCLQFVQTYHWFLGSMYPSTYLPPGKQEILNVSGDISFFIERRAPEEEETPKRGKKVPCFKGNWKVKVSNPTLLWFLVYLGV